MIKPGKGNHEIAKGNGVEGGGFHYELIKLLCAKLFLQ